MLSAADGSVVERGVVGESIGQKVGFIWVPEKRYLRPGRTVKFSLTSPRSVAVSLVNAVRPTMPDDGQLLKIALSGPDPHRTATTVNDWARQSDVGGCKARLVKSNFKRSPQI